MKGIGSILMAGLLGCILFTSCKRENITQEQTKKKKLSQIVYEFGKRDIGYYPDGSLKDIATSNNNTVLERTSLIYAGNKVDTVSINGVVYKYGYTNDRLSHIEVYPTPGDLVAKFEFTYANSVLSERIKLVMIGQPRQLTPYSKIKYTFDASGNVQKTQTYQWVFGGWNGTGEIVSYEYDDKENTISHIEQEPFLTANTLMKNNPLKEIYTTALGETTKTVVYNYTYNHHQQPVARQTKINAKGAAEINSIATLKYED